MAFRGGLALHVEFAAPAKGNKKGGVDGVHGFIEDNFFRPSPSFGDLDELNVALPVFCADNLKREHTTHHETIGTRFARLQLYARAPLYCTGTGKLMLVHKPPALLSRC